MQPAIATCLAAFFVSAAQAAGQCSSALLPGGNSSVLNGTAVCSTWWDPDGAGPEAPRIVIGGTFPRGGSITSNFLASYDPATRALGGFQTNFYGGGVRAVVGGSGELFAAGSFQGLDGWASIDHIARWNGSSWMPLDGGLSHPVNALARAANGDLYVGGEFVGSHGPVPVTAFRVARWDGSTWHPLGGGLNGTCKTLFVRGNGDLIASGSFTQAGGVPVNFVARWDGANWSSLGTGLGAIADAFLELPNGDLIAGGNFTPAIGGIAGVARWDGTSWSQVGSGLPNTVHALRLAANGDLLAATDGPSPSLMRFDGAVWTPVDPGSGQRAWTVEELPNGDLLLGGDFQQLGTTPVRYLARWNCSSWAQPGPSGLDGGIYSLAATPQGEVYAGGDFLFGGAGPSHVARWNGSSFESLGVGAGAAVAALLPLPDGSLVAAGYFTWIGGLQSPGIASWDGTTWQAMGSGLLGGAGNALTRDANGFVVVGGAFTIAGGQICNRVARWNGSGFTPLGNGLNNWVQALATLPDGSIVAGGNFTLPGGNFIARWNGTSWSALGGGADDHVQALAVLANGDLVAGGRFLTIGGVPASRVARWNGTTWSAYPQTQYPTPPVSSLLALPDGGFVTGTTKSTSARLWRWNGSTWSGGEADGHIRALALAANGELHVGGDFTTLALTSQPHHARMATTCPPALVTRATACAAPYDTSHLVARTVPWLASTFRAEAVDLPSASIAFGVLGFTPITPALPLSPLLPEAVSGCTLDVAADAVLLLSPSTEIAVPLPNSPSVIGADLFLQVTALVLGGGGSLQAIVTTGSLQATVGVF